MKKLFRNYSTVFMQIFLSMILIAFASIVIMVTVMSLWFRSEIVEEIKKQKFMSLMNLEHTVIQYTDTYNKAIQLLILDPKVRSILYDKDLLWSKDIYTVSNLINGILTINPYIESIYLLRVDQSLMKFNNRDQSLQFEEKLYEIISLGKRDVYWKCNNVNGTINKFHTIIIGNRYTRDSGYDNAVILTVNIGEIARTIFTENGIATENTNIINKENQIIMSSDLNVITDRLTDEEVLSFSKITDQFYAIPTKNGFFTSIYKSNKGFKIINTMNQPLGFNVLVPVIIVLGVIGLVVFILANLVAILLARKIYLPINGVFTNIKNLFSSDLDASPTSRSELQQLSHSLTNALKLMNDFERKKENDVFKALISNKILLQDGQVNNRLIKMKLFEWNGQGFVIAILRIRYFKEFLASHTDLTIDFQLNSIQILFQDYNKDKISNKMYQINEQEIIVIFKEESDSPLNRLQLIDYLGGFIQYVKETLNILLVVGMSQLYRESSLIRKSYDEAIEQIDRSFLIFNPTVVVEKELIEPDKCKFDFKKACEACIESTKEGNKTKFIDEFRKLLYIMQSYKYEEVVKNLLWLAIRIQQVKDKVLENEKSQYAEYYDKIITIKEIEVLENWFYDLFDEINIKMSEYRKIKVNDLIEKSIVYVHNHYNDVNLSANQLAASLGVTPVYFGKLFNDSCKQSFPDYVNDLRLSKAYSMLKEKADLDIADICNEVGFSSASYFSSKFKKKYGITPSKYRINIIYQHME